MPFFEVEITEKTRTFVCVEAPSRAVAVAFLSNGENCGEFAAEFSSEQEFVDRDFKLVEVMAQPDEAKVKISEDTWQIRCASDYQYMTPAIWEKE